MALHRWILVGATALAATFGSCAGAARDSQTLTPARRAEIEASVRKFVLQVAQDVIEEGPLIWRKHFADTPSFFMVMNGHMEFANGQAATQGIRDAAQKFPSVMLHWGDDLRVDVLTPEFAVVAATYHETLTEAAGHAIKADGYFTGVAEYQGGQWRFRNVHWSMPVPLPQGS